MKNKSAVLSILTLIFVGIFSTDSLAQELPKVMPPSPEATSVFKFGEVPVSLYTGVPNITIPIYDIEAKGLTIPISLSYHARGIQVAEIASQVGLGWSLNYGGMISRQIRGGRDEGTYGYLSQSNVTSSTFLTSKTIRQNLASGVATNYPEYDFIPDQYYFSANGLSGKFVFDQVTRNPVIQSFDNTKIFANSISMEEVSSGRGCTQFVLKDGMGNVYYYGISKDGNRKGLVVDEVQQSMIDPEIGGIIFALNLPDDSGYNTWQLMDIETAQGELIEFFYSNEEKIYYNRSYDAIENSQNFGLIYRSHVTKLLGRDKSISEIRFSQGKLVFTKTIERQDLSGAKSLDKITLYDKNNVKIKEFDLKYFYTSSPDLLNQNRIAESDHHARKRMFLESIQTKFESNSDTLPKYRFQYNKTVLPSRHSNSIDLWGYYNGMSNGRFLKFSGTREDSRAVDTLKSQAGMLEKIFTPQGGQTIFHYEHNKIKNDILPPSLIFSNPNPTRDRETGLGHLDYATNFASSFYEKLIDVNNFSAGSGSVNIWFDDETNCFSDVEHTDCNIKVSLSNLLGQPYSLFIGNSPLVLEQGTSSLRVRPKSGYNTQAMGQGFNITMKWKETIVDPSIMLYGGGKRIQKIEYKDSNNDLTLAKSYSYLNPTTGKTSGQLLGLSSFYSTKKKVYIVGLGLVPVTVLEPYGAVGGSPLSSYQGNSLGYEYVTEFQGDGITTIGKTQHRFTMIPDSGLYNSFPYHPPTDNEWLRGKELETTYFKQVSNGTYQKIKKIENTYMYGTNLITDNGVLISSDSIFSPIPAYLSLETDASPRFQRILNRERFRLPLIIFTPPDENNINNPVNYKVYHLTGGPCNLLSKKETDFFDNGSEIVTKTDYEYNYPRHYNVSEIKQKGSDNVVNSTRTYYPGDIEMYSKPERQKLIDQNILDVPLYTEHYKDLVSLSALETIYKDWNPAVNVFLLLPELIKTSKNNNASEIRIRYNRRDDKGNPLEIQQENGIKICYIWGYHGTQPIAKIENALYSQVESYVSNLQNLSNTNNEANLITALNSLRSDLPNAMITTFTYVPLVGVSTITDPKGDKITYHYDGFNRLKYVTDNQGKILKENQYHYRTQN